MASWILFSYSYNFSLLLQITCVFIPVSIQSLLHLVAALHCTTFFSTKPLLLSLVLFLNHPQQHRRKSCWISSAKVWEKIEVKMVRTILTVKWKKRKQEVQMKFRNLHTALRMCHGSTTLYVAVKEQWMVIMYPSEKKLLNLCRGAFQAWLHAVASVRGRERQVLQLQLMEKLRHDHQDQWTQYHIVHL